MTSSPLEKLTIATPCKADWSQMKGNDQKRFCDLCHLNVYNLSGLSQAEAEALIQNTEGRLCVRLFRRADGTVLTQDCPVGLAAQLRRRYQRLHAALITAVVGVAAAIGYTRWASRSTCATPMMGGVATQGLVATMGEAAARP